MAKFPWGDDPVPFKFILVLIVVHCTLNGIALLLKGPGGAVTADSYPSPASLHGVVLVTAAWVFLIYVAMGRQKGVQYTKKQHPDSISDAVATQAGRIAERGLMNTVEQSGPFLLCLWLHAIFVNPEVSVLFGWFYVISRFFYGLLYGMYGEMNLMVEVVTQNNYVVIGWWLLAIVFKCTSGHDLHTVLEETSPALVFLGTFFGDFLVLILGLMIIGQSGGSYIINGVKWNLGSADSNKRLLD